MDSAQQRRLPSLDGLRALAILLVMIRHGKDSEGAPDALRSFASSLPNGHFGVELFFVISGFIITHLLMREEQTHGVVSLTNFYRRRCYRILPALAAYLLCLAAMQQLSLLEISRADWFTSLTFTRNFIPGSWVTGHLWSLSVEEQFYVFWPCLFVWAPKHGRHGFAWALIALAPVTRALLLSTNHPGFASNSLPSNVDFLMAGAALALSSAQRSNLYLSRSNTLLRFLLVAGLGGLVILERDSASMLVRCIGPTLRALLFSALLGSVVFAPRGMLGELLDWAPLRYVGQWSYGLYLWQQLFLAPSGHFEAGGAWIAAYPWNFAFCFAVAVLSFTAVEGPFLDFNARQRNREAQSPQPTGL